MGLLLGDFIFLKLQPYVRSSVTPQAHHKLFFKYEWHYEVVKRVGDVASSISFSWSMCHI
jgi:hypothetical protein